MVMGDMMAMPTALLLRSKKEDMSGEKFRGRVCGSVRDVSRFGMSILSIPFLGGGLPNANNDSPNFCPLIHREASIALLPAEQGVKVNTCL